MYTNISLKKISKLKFVRTELSKNSRANLKYNIYYKTKHLIKWYLASYMKFVMETVKIFKNL